MSTPEQRSSPSPNSVKSFSKAVSEIRQKSNEKQRPVLSKTYSVVDQACKLTAFELKCSRYSLYGWEFVVSNEFSAPTHYNRTRKKKRAE